MIKLGDFVKAVMKKMKISCYLPLFLAKSEFMSLDAAKVAFVKEELNRYSKDPKTSCLAENKLDMVVDLQIIIPAYNVEKYICECLDSILLPDKKISYLVTVINDGSTDDTGKLLKKYNNISNVEIITQENRGFSSARNTGINNIKGRYITFVDSDDMVEWANIEKMVLIAEQSNADMVEGDFYTINESGKLKSRIRSNPNRFSGFLWGKIYKGEKWTDIALPEGYWYEDTIMEQILMERMHNKISFPEIVYYYRQNSKGISATSRRKNKSIDSLWILLALHKDRQLLGIVNSQRYYEFILRHIHLTYLRTKYQGDDIQKKIFLIFSDFLNREFPDYYSNEKKMRKFEKYVRSADYGKWKAFCEWIVI